jgi:ferritin-like metal-binding protein YciE
MSSLLVSRSASIPVSWLHYYPLMHVPSSPTFLSFDAIMFDNVKTLADLFTLKLQSLYDAEKQLVKALPKLATAATEPQLRISLEKHLCETEDQVARLEQIATSLGLSLDGPRCEAMGGLLEEADQLLALNTSDEVMDAAIISTAQGIEHYEIAQYNTVVHFAERLGYSAEALLLHRSLEEEQDTNEVLNQLVINPLTENALS